MVQSHQPLASIPSSHRQIKRHTPRPDWPTSAELLPGPSPTMEPKSLPPPCCTSLEPPLSNEIDSLVGVVVCHNTSPYRRQTCSSVVIAISRREKKV